MTRWSVSLDRGGFSVSTSGTFWACALTVLNWGAARAFWALTGWAR